jgi:hypothetical protein
VGSFEYNLLLILSFILVGGKCILWAYLLKKLIENTKKRESFEVDFIFGIFFLVSCFIVSRIIFIYVDFFLTGFDMYKYHLHPNALIWKVATVTYLAGTAVLMFIIDKKVLKFKFKGIFAYIIIAVMIFILIYPINTYEDFEAVGNIETIGILTAIIIFPIIFIYLGIKTARLRKIAFIFAFGIIIFAIGGTLLNRSLEAALVEAFGSQIRIFIWTLSITLKLTGLTMITYSCTKFY